MQDGFLRRRAERTIRSATLCVTDTRIGCNTSTRAGAAVNYLPCSPYGQPDRQIRMDEQISVHAWTSAAFLDKLTVLFFRKVMDRD